VSHHDSRKGLGTLLQAFRLLKQQGVDFQAWLVGGGGLLAIHRRMAGELGLDDRVRITGYVEDPEPYWQAASVFVLPSHEEGSGSLSLLEAMERGRAIVASGIDGIPEDVEDGRSGLLVPPKDPGALAGALMRLLKNKSLRESLARAARKRFEQRFAPSLLIRSMADLYDAAPGSFGRSPIPG
jgi:glycosyltransferase involved in cell wall biosynthesis